MVDSLAQHVSENGLCEQSALQQQETKVKEAKSRPKGFNMMRYKILVTNSC